MDTAQVGSAVWSSSAAVGAALLAICLGVYGWVGGRRARPAWFWAATALALALSGPAVRMLVDWRTAGPDLRVMPGLMATWAPAAVALTLSLGLGRRLVRKARKAQRAAPA